MEALVGPSPSFWGGKRVLLTGHTGFKGAWLSLWLRSLGANVFGLSLPPAERACLPRRVSIVSSAEPMAISAISTRLHGHARSGAGGSLSFGGAVLGAAVLPVAGRDLCDQCDGHGPCSGGCAAGRRGANVVIVTSDKCYENRETSWPTTKTHPWAATIRTAAARAAPNSSPPRGANRSTARTSSPHRHRFGARRQRRWRRRLGRGSADPRLHGCPLCRSGHRHPQSRLHSAMAACPRSTLRVSPACRTPVLRS